MPQRHGSLLPKRSQVCGPPAQARARKCCRSGPLMMRRHEKSNATQIVPNRTRLITAFPCDQITVFRGRSVRSNETQELRRGCPIERHVEFYKVNQKCQAFPASGRAKPPSQGVRGQPPQCTGPGILDRIISSLPTVLEYALIWIDPALGLSDIRSQLCRPRLGLDLWTIRSLPVPKGGSAGPFRMTRVVLVALAWS
jgi:hypothetical protein